MKKLVAVSCLCAAALTSTYAGHEVQSYDTTTTEVVEESPFHKGAVEVEVRAGGFGSVGTKGTAERPNVALVLGEIRAGIMLSTPNGGGIFRGNCELGLEVFGGGIVEGPGNGLVGVDLLLRYNFVQPGARFVPYIQVGGGGVYSDMASADSEQHLIGSDFSFSLEAEIGARWMLSDRVALITAFEYRHISNADTADRNRGLNVLGGMIGLSLFY